MSLKSYSFSFILLSVFFISCNNHVPKKTHQEIEIKFQNKGHEIVYEMVQKVGNHNQLALKKDVSYTYTYSTPNHETDQSNERYIFDGELSYGKYIQHERTLPHLKGEIEQGYNGGEFWLKHNGKIIQDKVALKRVAFNRPTNYYWFTMMQKLLDPGLIYQFLGDTAIENQNYSVVKVSFEPQKEKPTDIYQLYINKKTQLVDQFLFTVADFGKMEIPKLMQLQYEKVDGIYIPTIRRYKTSTWNAAINDEPWIEVRWSNIQFDSGIQKSEFNP